MVLSMLAKGLGSGLQRTALPYCGWVKSWTQIMGEPSALLTSRVVVVLVANEGMPAGSERVVCGTPLMCPAWKGKVSPSYVSVPTLMGPSPMSHDFFAAASPPQFWSKLAPPMPVMVMVYEPP